jgi:hypothetical protein
LNPTCSACASCMHSFAFAASSAARQVHTYLTEYSKVAHLPATTMADLAALFVEIQQSTTPTAHGQAAGRYLQYAAAAARAKWTQFKPGRIASGLSILAAVAALAAAAVPVLIRSRTTFFAETNSLSRLFYLLPTCTVDAMRLPFGSAALASMLIAAARCLVPFSNSLVLGELQVVTLLSAVGVAVAAGAAMSRIAALHTRVAEVYYTLPSFASPFTLARYWCSLVALALAPAASAPQPPGSTGAAMLSSTAEPGANFVAEPAPMRLRGKRFRSAPLIIALACMVLSLWLPWTFTRIAATAIFAAFVAILMRMHWSFLDPTHATPATQWQQLTLQATTRAGLFTAALAVCALGSCYGLSRFGGIDRTGANPFDKAAEATNAPLPNAPRLHPLAIAAPALMATSVLATQIDRAAQRVVRLPATVRRFGSHVPVWKVLGDALLYLKGLGGVFTWLLPDRRLLLVLLELDAYDDELQQAEANSHHMPTLVCDQHLHDCLLWICYALHRRNLEGTGLPLTLSKQS